MKTRNIIFALRTAGFGLLAAAAFTACSESEFVRDAGSLPGKAGTTPSGALYATGSFDPELQDFTISEDCVVNVVYRLDFAAQTDVRVTLELGDEYDVNAYNDAKGLKDDPNFRPNVLAPYKRYRMLPETNYELPASLTLTVPKGRTESAPITVKIIYDETLLPSEPDFGKRMLWPWMLPLTVVSVEGEVVPIADQMLGIGVRPANSPDGNSEMTWMPIELLPKEEPFTFITFCDCREFDPSYAIYYYYSKANYVQGQWGIDLVYETIRESSMFDIEVLHPAFLAADAKTGMPIVQASSDLLYVLTHQDRYVAPQRKLGMKICVSIETQRKSPLGLCNLDDQARASLVWQIKNLVETYRLEGVSFNDKAADYAADGATAVDKASYTRFLKELRAALGTDKLIMVSYDADANSALYEAHDGLQAGDYIDYAWWGVANEFCTPYAAVPTVQPIAGLGMDKFSPMLGDCVETDAYMQLFYPGSDPDTGTPYPQLGLPALKELNDQGQCSVLVYLTLRANLQNFYEGGFSIIPEVFGQIPLHEGDGFSAPGWFSRGSVNREAMKNLPHFSGYGSGLKDW